MSDNLEWSRSDWGAGVTAKGAGGYYIIMVFAAMGSSRGRYVASHRSCHSDEPHYFGRFALSPQGLEDAKRACQAREDFATRRVSQGA